MRLIDILGLAATTLVMACQPSFELSNQQRNIQQSIIEDQVDAWVQALNNRELDSVIGMYEASESLVVSWPNGMRSSGVEAASQGVTDFYNTIQYMNFAPQNIAVDVINPGAAVVTFRFSVDIVHNDTSRDPFAGQGTIVLTRESEEGDWMIRSQQLSRNM